MTTYGFDDAKKAAGVSLHDVKTDHVTIRLEDGNNAYTTGFTPNLLHSSQDQTATFKHKLQVLTILAGEGVAVEDLLEQIKFLDVRPCIA